MSSYGKSSEMIQEHLDPHDKHQNHNDNEFRVEWLSVIGLSRIQPKPRLSVAV